MEDRHREGDLRAHQAAADGVGAGKLILAVEIGRESSDHARCGGRVCRAGPAPPVGYPVVMPEEAAALFGGREDVQGGVVFFRRCPARQVTRFSHAMLRWFMWQDQWGITPFQLGATMEELDPRYFPAMETLKAATERVKAEELERIRKENQD